jgi:hypothetical protein
VKYRIVLELDDLKPGDADVLDAMDEDDLAEEAGNDENWKVVERGVVDEPPA